MKYYVTLTTVNAILHEQTNDLEVYVLTLKPCTVNLYCLPSVLLLVGLTLRIGLFNLYSLV